MMHVRASKFINKKLKYLGPAGITEQEKFKEDMARLTAVSNALQRNLQEARSGLQTKDQPLTFQDCENKTNSYLKMIFQTSCRFFCIHSVSVHFHFYLVSLLF